MKKINRNPPPKVFVENKLSLDNWHRYVKPIRDALVVDFDNKCAYCESDVGITSHAEIENFYPKSKFPFDIAFEWNNLLLSCSICNAAKRDRFPVNDKGEPLLINPSNEDTALHIKLDKETGLYEGITDKGKVTISTLNLNRIGLVARRKEKILLETISNKFPQVQTNTDSDTIYNNFIENLESIKFVISSRTEEKKIEGFVNNMLYASVITAMETYLSDVFINAVITNQAYLRKFVETYPKFKKSENESSENIMKFPLSKIFEYHDEINEIVIKEILSIIYHNLTTVSPMFKDTFDVNFPKNLGVIYKAILIRHDIVHRNGRTKIDEKTKIAKIHDLEKNDVLDLIEKVKDFIAEIDAQMRKI